LQKKNDFTGLQPQKKKEKRQQLEKRIQVVDGFTWLMQDQTYLAWGECKKYAALA